MILNYFITPLFLILTKKSEGMGNLNISCYLIFLNEISMYCKVFASAVTLMHRLRCSGFEVNCFPVERVFDAYLFEVTFKNLHHNTLNQGIGCIGLPVK